jgi:hypothetical protein
LSGGTGEFYFSSIATNGVDVHDVSSEKLGAGGVFEKVTPGDWIDTESLLLWPDVDGPSQKTEAITIGFRLLERDDDAVAKKILDGSSIDLVVHISADIVIVTIICPGKFRSIRTFAGQRWPATDSGRVRSLRRLRPGTSSGGTAIRHSSMAAVRTARARPQIPRAPTTAAREAS